MFKTTFFSLILGLISSVGLAAQRDASPLWFCSMKAKVQNDSLIVGVGGVDKHGPAIVKCWSPADGGQFFSKQVYVEISGAGLGLDVNFKKQQTIYMGTANLGVHDWRQFLGKHTLQFGVTADALVLETGSSLGVEFGGKAEDLNKGGELAFATGGIGLYASAQELSVYESRQAFMQHRLVASVGDERALATFMAMTRAEASSRVQP